MWSPCVLLVVLHLSTSNTGPMTDSIMSSNTVQGSNILDVLKKKMRQTKEEMEKYKEDSEDMQKKLQVEIMRREEVSDYDAKLNNCSSVWYRHLLLCYLLFSLRGFSCFIVKQSQPVTTLCQDSIYIDKDLKSLGPLASHGCIIVFPFPVGHQYDKQCFHIHLMRTDR